MDFAKNVKQQIKIIMYNIYLYVWGGGSLVIHRKYYKDSAIFQFSYIGEDVYLCPIIIH